MVVEVSAGVRTQYWRRFEVAEWTTRVNRLLCQGHFEFDIEDRIAAKHRRRQ